MLPLESALLGNYCKPNLSNCEVSGCVKRHPPMPSLPLQLDERLARMRGFKATKIKAREEQNRNHLSVCFLALFTSCLIKQCSGWQWLWLCHASESPGELVKICIAGPTLIILDSVGQMRDPENWPVSYRFTGGADPAGPGITLRETLGWKVYSCRWKSYVLCLFRVNSCLGPPGIERFPRMQDFSVLNWDSPEQTRFLIILRIEETVTSLIFLQLGLIQRAT